MMMKIYVMFAGIIHVSACDDCGKLLFENEWYELQTGDERHELFCTECYEERIRNVADITMR